MEEVLWLFPFGKMALSLPTMTGERVSVSDDSILPSRGLWQENQGGYFCSLPSRTGLFISKIVWVSLPRKGSVLAFRLRKGSKHNVRGVLLLTKLALCLKRQILSPPPDYSSKNTPQSGRQLSGPKAQQAQEGWL